MENVVQKYRNILVDAFGFYYIWNDMFFFKPVEKLITAHNTIIILWDPVINAPLNYFFTRMYEVSNCKNRCIKWYYCLTVDILRKTVCSVIYIRLYYEIIECKFNKHFLYIKYN